MGYSVYLKKGEEKRIVAGHSWVYANEVAKIEGKDKNGSLAGVFSHDGRFIGKGYINHASKILVRIFIRDNSDDSEAFYEEKIAAAKLYREKLGYKNCYRAVFAESDGIPALIVDKYGSYLSVQFLALGVDLRKEMICRVLIKIFKPKGIYERSDAAVRKKEGLEEVKGVLWGCDAVLDGAYEADEKETKRRILGSANQRIICLTDRYKDCIEDWFLQNENKSVEVNISSAIVVNGAKI